MNILKKINPFKKSAVEKKTSERIKSIDTLNRETEKIKKIYKEMARLQKIIDKKLEAAKKDGKGAKKRKLKNQLEELDKASEEMFRKLKNSMKEMKEVNAKIEKFWNDYMEEVKAVKEIHESL